MTDIEKWANDFRPHHRGLCKTCALSEETHEAIQQFAALMKRPDVEANWMAFHREVMVPEYRYPYSAITLKRHVRHCVEKDD